METPNALVDVVLLVGMDDNTSLVPTNKVSHFTLIALIHHNLFIYNTFVGVHSINRVS